MDPYRAVTPGQIVALAMLGEGGLAIVAVIGGWALGCPVWSHIEWTLAAGLAGAAASLPLVMLMLGLVHLKLPVLRSFQHLIREQIAPLFGGCTLGELALVSLSAGVGEELLFRGLVQQAASARWGDVVGLAAASAVFGLAHPISRFYVVFAAAIGAYLGWLWLASGNLLVPIVTHAVYDFAALVYLTRGRKRWPDNGG